jgi:NAD(P)-dependent dehydrogenase (short-subunit alcohol dehydrogenase family)
MSAKRFQGRPILVTGGASGIGRATALAFAREGGRVAVADLAEEAGRAVVADIVSVGGEARLFLVDATDETAVAGMIAQMTREIGPIRHAFNNVGTTLPGTIETMTREIWDRTLAISITATFLAMKHEIPIMRANQGGTIVNTASIAGKLYVGNSPAYAVAKAGVVHLSHCAACAYGQDNIRVNSVSPGLVATPLIDRLFSATQQAEVVRRLHGIERAVTPEEVAATVLYLSSDDAGMISGIDVEVNGGRRS